MSSNSTNTQSTTPTPVSGTCRLADGVLWITKTDRKGKETATDYHVERLSVERTAVTNLIRLTKRLANGVPSDNPDHQYECWEEAGAQHCTCMDYTSRRENKDFAGCKHLRSLRAVNLLPKVEEPS